MEQTKLILAKFDEGWTAYKIGKAYNINLKKVLRLLIKNGRDPEKNRGQPRVLTEEHKLKLSQTRRDGWANMTDDEREKRSQKAREQWENMSDDVKSKISSKAAEGRRKSAKHGSKLEFFLLNELSRREYIVDFHKEFLLANASLHLDLWLPKLSIAIEIDGPTHFLPIHGAEALKKVQKADNQKNGLLRSNGYNIIRVKNLVNTLSKYNKNYALAEVLKSIEKIVSEKLVGSYFEIEVTSA